jgi:cell wall-associated NlpC family hydrolase
MCVTRISTTPIASNIESLEQARNIAKNHQGSEVITKDRNGNYSVTELKPSDVDKTINQKGSNFSPQSVEFSIQKTNGSSSTLINTNAKFTDKARSELLNVKENAIELGHKINETYEEVKETFIDNTEKLFDNLTKKTSANKYVKGGEVVDVNKGVVQADCSGFVLNMFEKAGMDLTKTDMTAADIGKYIRDGKGFLTQVKKASDVKPTDVITFDKDPKDKAWYTGHVMVAVSTPKPIYDSKNKVIGYNVDIIDSTSVAHGNDNRSKAKSGAGFGTISFSVDKSGNIASFYWGKDFTGKQHSHNVTVGAIK